MSITLDQIATANDIKGKVSFNFSVLRIIALNIEARFLGSKNGSNCLIIIQFQLTSTSSENSAELN